jgi:hypothetical protein
MTKYWVVPAPQLRPHAWAIVTLDADGAEYVVSRHRSQRKAQKIIDTLLATNVAQDMAQWRDIIASPHPRAPLNVSRSATMSPDDLRDRAIRYRAAATQMNDAQTIKALQDLAAECEALANSTEAQWRTKASGDSSNDRD